MTSSVSKTRRPRLASRTAWTALSRLRGAESACSSLCTFSRSMYNNTYALCHELHDQSASFGILARPAGCQEAGVGPGQISSPSHLAGGPAPINRTNSPDSATDRSICSLMCPSRAWLRPTETKASAALRSSLRARSKSAEPASQTAPSMPTSHERSRQKPKLSSVTVILPASRNSVTA